MNGLNIKLKTEMRILITPPMSPNIYKKLYVCLEWIVLTPSKKNATWNIDSPSLGSIY